MWDKRGWRGRFTRAGDGKYRARTHTYTCTHRHRIPGMYTVQGGEDA